MGNVYGTTTQGGSSSCSGFGCGVVYKLSPTVSGRWKENILYKFGGAPADGASPVYLAFDQSGNLYGTAQSGGGACFKAFGCGLVFELSPKPSGSWTETILHTFTGIDGQYPWKILFDVSGNLYGTTDTGGVNNDCSVGCGVVYELSPTSSGGWTQTVIHDFGVGDGALPSGLVMDANGNLYGTTVLGGANNQGTAFKLSPSSSSTWTESVLFSFAQNASGGYAYSPLLDSSGNLFGVTYYGGKVSNNSSGYGVVFKLYPAADIAH
jgi:uncharacterized repeat protein (TIGR03803 family)